MKSLYTTWTVTIAWEWQKKFNDEREGSKYTFGSLKGCNDWVSSQILRGEENPENKVLWYAIEGLNHYPCSEKEPEGQLYAGMIHHEYVSLEII